jgi:homoserine O-acetyltransferase/O-succinyltransferase
MDYEILELGDVRLQRGGTLREAKLAYKTYGELNADKTNAIVYPTWYSGQHYENEWLIGEGMALDPTRYFIVIPNMLGNGISSSPSNTPPPHDRAAFPQVTMYDNVELQHSLVTERFGIATGTRHGLVNVSRADLSMGGQSPRHGQADTPLLRCGEDQPA